MRVSHELTCVASRDVEEWKPLQGFYSNRLYQGESESEKIREVEGREI